MAQNRIIEWPNHKLPRLQEDLFSYISSIERWKSALRTHQGNLYDAECSESNYQTAIDVLLKYRDEGHVFANDHVTEAIEHLDSKLATYRSKIISLKRDIATAETRISEFTSHKLHVEFEIKALDDSPVEIDVKTFRKQLRSDRVKAVRFKTAIVNGQEQFRGISITLNPGTATVRNTRYPIDPVISIPACTISIAGRGSLKITAKNGQGFRGYSSSPVPHPHVLSYQEPCLGDFGGPFWEALDDRDLVSALSILLLFLETVDANDAAGSYWNRWPWLNRDELMMECDRCGRSVELHDPYTHYSDCEYHPDYVSTDELAEALADFDEPQAADDMYLSRID